MSTPEGRVKARLNKQLETIPYQWKFMPVQTGYGKKALDYLICIKGRFVVIETKAKGKDLTGLQKHTRAEMEAAGAKVFVVDDDESMMIAINWMKAFVTNPL